MSARLLRPLAVSVVLLGLATVAAAAHSQWFGAKAFLDSSRVQDAGVAGAYLDAERVTVGHPFVLIVGSEDWNNVAQIGNTARASMPPDRLASLYLFVGTPDAYLAHKPIDNVVSRSYFLRMRSVYDRDPVALLLASFNPQTFDGWVAAHPSSQIAPTVAVVQGPLAQVPLVSRAPPTGRVSWWVLGLYAVGVLLVLTAVGGGWTLVAFGHWFRPVELLAASPTLGIAAIVVTGSVVDRAGARLTGLVGAVVPVMAGLAGWAAWYAATRRAKARA